MIREARESNKAQIKVLEDIELERQDMKVMQSEINGILMKNYWVVKDEEQALDRWQEKWTTLYD